jgi:secreted PhoX family phosphatase
MRMEAEPMKDTTDHIVDPRYDFRANPAYEPGDERPSNWSGNPTFYDVVETRFSRRGVMAGGIAAAVTGVIGGLGTAGSLRAQTSPSSLLGFEAVTTSEADAITVPPGYRAQVIAASGSPITGTMPAYSPANNGAEQGMQIGQHHDGIHFFPIGGSSTDGLLVMNHEYIEPRFLHADYAGSALDSSAVIYRPADNAEGDSQAADARDPDEVLKEMNAHGVSVVRVRRGEDDSWAIVEDPHNRRITALTEMEIGGPVRGSAHVVTRFSPDGTRVRGTLNNCANGFTPWNTYMSAEENWAGYFVNTDAEQPREHARYGVASEQPGDRYGWHLAAGGADECVRFDATATGASAAEDYRNEPNGFGWMVEIDPFDPESVPVKRTHLGRFAHEGVVFGPVEAGRPVVAYSGDDARFEYIYKFVSASPYDPATTDGSILDAGTLYAAKFNDDGTGEWLALAPGENGLTPENGFADLADILVNTRAAADQAGATKMDRPEWGAVDPQTGEVYFTLTNNTRRMQTQVDMANPRAVNQFGHIIKWTEAGGDHAATTFDWDLFVIAGDRARSATYTGEALDETNAFACPDGLWIDEDRRVWIQTDVGEAEQNQGDFAQFGNNQMLCADPVTGEVKRFLTGPVGQEITGIAMTPGRRTLFVNVQHPGATTSEEDYAAGTPNSHWPDGGDSWPRSATVVITREDGGIIGT